MAEYDLARASVDLRRFSRIRRRLHKKVATNCLKTLLLIFLAQIITMYIAKFMLSSANNRLIEMEKKSLPNILVSA